MLFRSSWGGDLNWVGVNGDAQACHAEVVHCGWLSMEKG